MHSHDPAQGLGAMFARGPESANESSSIVQGESNSHQSLHNKFSSALRSASPTAFPTA